MTSDLHGHFGATSAVIFRETEPRYTPLPFSMAVFYLRARLGSGCTEQWL